MERLSNTQTSSQPQMVQGVSWFGIVLLPYLWKTCSHWDQFYRWMWGQHHISLGQYPKAPQRIRRHKNYGKGGGETKKSLFWFRVLILTQLSFGLTWWGPFHQEQSKKCFERLIVGAMVQISSLLLFKTHKQLQEVSAERRHYLASKGECAEWLLNALNKGMKSTNVPVLLV